MIRPEFRKLEGELGRLQETADELNAAKMEAEAKLAQVNARFSAYARRQQLEHAQGADASPSGHWRGGGGEGGAAGGGGVDDGLYPYAQSPHMVDGSRQQLRRPGSGDTPVPNDLPQQPHVNKRLRPVYGQDASPRGFAQQDGAAAGYGAGYARGLDPQLLGRSSSHERGERTARHHAVDNGLLNPASAPVTPMPYVGGFGGRDLPARAGGALGRGGPRLGAGGVCESPPGPSRLPGLHRKPPPLHRGGVQGHARHSTYGL